TGGGPSVAPCIGDFLWSMSSDFFRTLPQLLPRHRRQVGRMMIVAPRPLLVVVRPGPLTLPQREERHLIHEVPQRLVAGRWHRQLTARKWTFTPPRSGRPGVMKAISALIVRMATENPGWGYTRIQGALKNLGHGVARSTVAKVLKANGIPPA